MSDCKLWVMDRSVFQVIMMKTGVERQDETVELLKSVQLLKSLSSEKLTKIADVVEVVGF